MNHRTPLLIVVGVLALASASLAAVCGDPDAIATPASEATATASIAAPATPTPADTATPVATSESDPSSSEAATPSPKTFRGPAHQVPALSSTSDPMILAAVLWVDGARASGEVVAYIAGNECGRGLDVGPFTMITIAADAQQSGCGIPGADITIEVNGRQMDDTVDWLPGYQPQMLTLYTGPLVGQYGGDIRVDPDLRPKRVVAIVDGTLCGSTSDLRGNGELVSYELVVASDDVTTGCGRSDAIVELRVEGTTTNGDPFDAFITAVPWQPGPPTLVAEIDLTGQIVATPAQSSSPSVSQ